MSESALSRVQDLGIKSASLVDLLAVGLAQEESDLSRMQEIALRLVPSLQMIRGLADLSTHSLEEHGVDGFAAIRFQALLELGRRLGGALKGPGTQIDGPEQVAELLEGLRFEKKEHFIALLLDAQNVVIRMVTVHVGTLTTSVVGPREVFREAIREGASGLIVAHNHPSGDPRPSAEDLEITAKLVEIGKMLDIPLFDHVILGERKFTSLRNEGKIK
jgi:DNA repair protein RadC